MNESVQQWLDELTSSSSSAIQKLVLGYAGVSAWSRSSLRESFVEIYQTHAEALDAAVAGWLQERLMKLPPEKTPTLVWASHLQDLFSALAGLPLPQVARLLRDRLRDFRSWLRPLRTDESLDPEAAYLAALAWADTNQHLEGMWQGLALRRDREPAYYLDIGLLGLRKTRDEHGQLPPKAPFLLLATLLDLADTGISQKDWLLTTRALLGGYHYSLETWVREFQPVIETRQDAEHGPVWLKKVLPQLRASQQSQRRNRHDIPPAHSRQEKDAIISEVAARDPEALGERLAVFLQRERNYANATRNPHFLVRTFNRLAEATRTHAPDWAIARAEESLEWDPNHEFCWTALARALWSRGFKEHQFGNMVEAEASCREAIDTLWKARYRFWWNPYLRTELGRLHREAGDLKTAEAIYREAVAEFPNNPASPDALAEVLLDLGKIDEAEEIFRKSRSRFPDDTYCRYGLAKILRQRFANSGDRRTYEEMRELLKEAKDLDRRRARSGDRSFASHRRESVPLYKRPPKTDERPARSERERPPEIAAKAADSKRERPPEIVAKAADSKPERPPEIVTKVGDSKPERPLEIDAKADDSQREHPPEIAAKAGDSQRERPLEIDAKADDSQREHPPEIAAKAGDSQRERPHEIHAEADDSQREYLPEIDEKVHESVPMAIAEPSEMRPAQRLGRALLFQWQAQRAEAVEERERLFAEAETLLTLPDELTGECGTAFMEARGFLLLARDLVNEARAYFAQQLAANARRPLGLRLGFAEARARVGETLSDTEEAELSSFGPEGSILPLVLKVVRLLASTASDEALRDLLLELYPRVRELAGMPASELGEEDERAEPSAPARQPETPDTMMAQLLLASVFRPAAINTAADLQVDSIPRVRTSLRAHRDDIFSVAEKLALALDRHSAATGLVA